MKSLHVRFTFDATPFVAGLKAMQASFRRVEYCIHRTTGASPMTALRLAYGPRYQWGAL